MTAIVRTATSAALGYRNLVSVVLRGDIAERLGTTRKIAVVFVDRIADDTAFEPHGMPVLLQAVAACRRELAS